MWHLKLADNSSNMGFMRCRADFELWLHPWMDNYEYNAVIKYGLLLFTNNPAGILEPMKKLFG